MGLSLKQLHSVGRTSPSRTVRIICRGTRVRLGDGRVQRKQQQAQPTPQHNRTPLFNFLLQFPPLLHEVGSARGRTQHLADMAPQSTRREIDCVRFVIMISIKTGRIPSGVLTLNSAVVSNRRELPALIPALLFY